MKITFLGTGTCHQQADRSTTAIDCLGWGTHFLLDIGSGTLRRMREADVDPLTIEALFLSHTHPDHLADFVPLVHMYLWNLPKARGRTLYVFAPPGSERILWSLIQIYLPNDYDSLPFKVDIREVKDSAIDFGKIKVLSSEVEHVEGMTCLGYRFEQKNKSFVFSGDTGPCKSLKKLSQGADLLIADANNSNAVKSKGHMNPVDAARLANEAKVKELVLTHISPHVEKEDLQEGKREFNGLLTIAEDFMEMKL